LFLAVQPEGIYQKYFGYKPKGGVLSEHGMDMEEVACPYFQLIFKT
jgi:hypothetical protein